MTPMFMIDTLNASKFEGDAGLMGAPGFPGARGPPGIMTTLENIRFY